MFASHEITVEVTPEEALGQLTHLINHGGLHPMSDATYQDGLDMLRPAGPFEIEPGLSKLVEVRTRPPTRTDTGTVISIRWEASGLAGALIPVLDADLSVEPEGEHRCRLRLLGSYRPPLGRVGAALDDKTMELVGTATIRRLLEQLAATASASLPNVHLDGAPAAEMQPVAEPNP